MWKETDWPSLEEMRIGRGWAEEDDGVHDDEADAIVVVGELSVERVEVEGAVAAVEVLRQREEGLDGHADALRATLLI